MILSRFHFVFLLIIFTPSLVKAQSSLAISLNEIKATCTSFNDIISSSCLDSIVSIIGKKTIIGLGEGTHGTKEFNIVRTAISKRLIAEEGFNYICFENNYGETFLFNMEFNKEQPIESLLKKHFIGIYQTPELLDFFNWLSIYNRKNNDAVKVSGLDFFELSATCEILKNQIINIEEYSFDLNRLSENIAIQDSLRNHQLTNHGLFKTATLSAYKILNRLNEDKALKIRDVVVFKEAFFNLMVRNEFYYQAYQNPENASLDRDYGMASMLKFIRMRDSKAKIIVLAHNTHISKHYVFGKGKNGGGMGGYIEAFFPDEYMALATTTSKGTFSVTKDIYPTRFNQFMIQKFPSTTKESIERLFNKSYTSALYNIIDEEKLGKVHMMFPGFQYSPNYTPNFEIIIQDYFDVLYHLPKTQAAIHIN